MGRERRRYEGMNSQKKEKKKSTIGRGEEAEEDEEKRKRKEKKNRTLKTTRKKSLEKSSSFVVTLWKRGVWRGKYSLTNGPNNLKFYKNFSFFFTLFCNFFYISLSLTL